LKLIFISGLPGVGKLTVAKELSARTGCPLFHNHLTVDLLLSVFDFGSAPFIELRESIWLSVFDEACRANLPGLIFTFNAENSVRQSFTTKLEQNMAAAGATISYIELTCSEAELERRMDSPSRREYHKLTAWQQFQELRAAGVFSSPVLPEPILRLETGALAAQESAARIASACGI